VSLPVTGRCPQLHHCTPEPLQYGSKLLAADVKIASRLMGKIVQGKTLSRCV
jgi:hypothetical protein